MTFHPHSTAIDVKRNLALPGPSLVLQEARAWTRHLSVDSLLDYELRFRLMVADEEADPLERYNAGERLRAVKEALARVDRVARQVAGMPSSADSRYVAWSELARIVRERVELPEIFELAGHELRPVGRNSRRGAAEYAGPCPVCRDGEDRLRVWGGPNGRAWCRQCEWSADVIAVVQSFVQGCEEWRDAIKWLAKHAGASIGGGL